MFRRSPLALLLLVALFAATAALCADEDEEPIPSGVEEDVVVSSDVAKDRHDPASFTNLDQDEIRDLNTGQDLSMLLGETMNAYTYSDAGNGYGYSYLRIRGFDQARIAVNVNGVPLNTPESHQVFTINLGDFAAGLGLIQIQRGPGTALYGSPAVGGVVNLETASLSTAAGGNLELDGGSFGTSRISLGYGGPVGKSPWAFSVRAAHVESNGYRTPSWSKQTFVQIGFERFSPTSVWRVLLFGGPEETQLAYFGVPYEALSDPVARRSIAPLQPGETDNFFQPQLQVMNDRRIGPGLMLKNTVYAILGNGYFKQFATSLTYDPLGELPPTPTYPDESVNDAWTERSLDNRQIGWIPRIAWSHGHGELTAGVELLFHRGRHDGTVTSGAVCTDPPLCTSTSPVADPLVLYDYTNRKDTANLFVREELRVAPSTTINLELQATRHDFSMGQDEVRGISWDTTYNFLSPRLGVNWNINDRWNLYAQATKTESEPTFNNVWNPEDPSVAGTDPAEHFESYDPTTNHYSDPIAKPERLTSFELGAGYAQGATRLKMNVYRMQFKDEFVFAGGLDSDGVPITTNANQSLHEGIEIAASGRIPGDVDLSGYLAVSNDVLEEATILSPDGATVYAIDYSGNRIALFPGSTARLAVARTFGPVRVELSGRRIGTIYTDNSENERKTPAVRSTAGYVNKEIDPFTVVGAQVVADLSRPAHLKTGALILRLRIDNLLDSQITQFGYSYPTDPAFTTFYSEFYPAATRSVMLGLSFGF